LPFRDLPMRLGRLGGSRPRFLFVYVSLFVDASLDPSASVLVGPARSREKQSDLAIEVMGEIEH